MKILGSAMQSRARKMHQTGTHTEEAGGRVGGRVGGRGHPYRRGKGVPCRVSRCPLPRRDSHGRRRRRPAVQAHPQRPAAETCCTFEEDITSQVRRTSKSHRSHRRRTKMCLVEHATMGPTSYNISSKINNHVIRLPLEGVGTDTNEPNEDTGSSDQLTALFVVPRRGFRIPPVDGGDAGPRFLPSLLH